MIPIKIIWSRKISFQFCFFLKKKKIFLLRDISYVLDIFSRHDFRNRCLIRPIYRPELIMVQFIDSFVDPLVVPNLKQSNFYLIVIGPTTCSFSHGPSSRFQIAIRPGCFFYSMSMIPLTMASSIHRSKQQL